ncbi:hypothetical protein AAMO2058_000623400, partial [Amorphochlora amoebiformis]
KGLHRMASVESALHDRIATLEAKLERLTCLEESEGLRKRKVLSSDIKKSTNQQGPRQPTSDEDDDPQGKKYGRQPWVRNTVGFQIVRSILIAVLFLVLHHYFTKHILNPWLHPNMDESAWKRDMVKRICPNGANCEFDLKDEWKIFQDGDA